MGGHYIKKNGVGANAKLAAEPRSFLFLQGPISDFFDRLGRALLARGHRVHRINLHGGDRLFWRLPATNFRGRFDDWRAFIGEMLERHGVTDLVLHGDRRPYHIVAAEEARARGIAVIATDLGYVRPDWITLEHDGMSTYSRFPRDPEAIRELAPQFPIPDLPPRFHTPFWLISVLDILYNLGLVFGRPLYPHYRYHGIAHPFAEYFGWICSRLKQLATGHRAARLQRRLRGMPGAYFVFPLQLPTDFQIRAHSPFADAREALREVIASFARSGSRRRLVIVVHPLDNGLIDWCGLASGLAQRFGVSDRVVAFEGGVPGEILCHAAGIVTINSTIGTTALGSGVPVKVLGNAVFDIPGLTSQQPLDAFWQKPEPPDQELALDFLRALIGATQVKGGYYTRGAQNEAIAGFITRLEGGLHPLPPLDAADLAERRVREPRRTVAITGLADQDSLALARAYAGPGASLLLIGAARMLGGAAEDCRRRGAIVETLAVDHCDTASLAGHLKAQAFPNIDVLAVSAVDLGRAMAAVDGLQERLQPGTAIVLVGRRNEELLRYAGAARRRLRAQGVAVAIAAPGLVATGLAARWRDPWIAMVGPDKAARLICRGIQRRRRAIAIPGAPTALLRTARLAVSRFNDWLTAPDPAAAAPIAEEPVAGRSGTGN
jgi:capsular polysaccharide export protein